MRIALRDGDMHYVDEGSGPPILFVHGTPTNSFEYRHLIAALSKRFRCIAPDHLGFGQSSRPRSFAYTPEAHAAVLKEFVERLGLDGLHARRPRLRRTDRTAARTRAGIRASSGWS